MYIPRYTGMSAYVCVQREEKKKNSQKMKDKCSKIIFPSPQIPNHEFDAIFALMGNDNWQ